MNSITLVGRLATDPELKYTPSGVAVTNFVLAVRKQFTPPSGERDADFITVKVWRQNAENVANYLQKGRLAGVSGRLEIREWVDQQGQKRKTAEVVADRVDFLDKAPEGQGGPRPPREDGEEGGAYNAPRPAGGGENNYQARPAPAAGGFNRQPAPAPAYAGGSAGGSDEPDFGDPFADQ